MPYESEDESNRKSIESGTFSYTRAGTISQSQLENFVWEIYDQFYKDNKELFRTNPVLYWHEAGRYKDKKLQDYIYYGKNTLKSKTQQMIITPEIIS